MPYFVPRPGSRPSLMYRLMRCLFRLLLNIFYANIIIENAEAIPVDGQPCLICANHSNSVTDAMLLVTSVPSSARRMLRTTAKETLVNGRGFVSWAIRQMGPVPIARPKDYEGIKVDNRASFFKLIEALEKGDAVCIFPEGISRYHPEIAPLKTGAARIVSDTLLRNADNSNFELNVVTCAITYLHRELFRSDILVTFSNPLVLTTDDHMGLGSIKNHDEATATSIVEFTKLMEEQIRAGTLNAPSWEILRAGHVARRLYCPFGTKLALGDYVRITQVFSQAFTKAITRNTVSSNLDLSADDIQDLMNKLLHYQNRLSHYGIKDDRIRTSDKLNRKKLIYRCCLRLAQSTVLSCIALPGFIVWSPIFIAARVQSRRLIKKGPVSNVYDEVAQTKLITGLFGSIVIYIILCCIMSKYTPLLVNMFFIPMWMWMTIRWLEDLVSAARSARALFILLGMGKEQLKQLRSVRLDLYNSVMQLAVAIGLPPTVDEFIDDKGPRRSVRKRLRYFSLKRRAKKDWNETLKLRDVSDYVQ